MNIIEAIKNRKEFERLTVKYQKTLQCHRWFAGWKDLDIIWKYILDDINFGGIETARKDYAKARNTDEYGTNSNGAVTITREDFGIAADMLFVSTSCSKRYNQDNKDFHRSTFFLDVA